MSKELLISSSPHETKVAVLEDDELVEVYYQRDTDVGLVGGIYKGRVSRVLPGMQSAFVDIGLGRDAFLYVSDFFEDSEEYDRVLTEAEARVGRCSGEAETVTAAELPAQGAQEQVTHSENSVTKPGTEAASRPVLGSTVGATPTTTPLSGPEHGLAAMPPEPAQAVGVPISPTSPGSEVSVHRQHEHRGRRRRRRGRGFGESRFGSRPQFRDRPAERPEGHTYETTSGFEILPGESLAKYSQAKTEAAPEVESSAPRSGHDAAAATPAGCLRDETVARDAETGQPDLTRHQAAEGFPTSSGPAAETGAVSSASPLEGERASPALEGVSEEVSRPSAVLSTGRGEVTESGAQFAEEWHRVGLGLSHEITERGEAVDAAASAEQRAANAAQRAEHSEMGASAAQSSTLAEAAESSGLAEAAGSSSAPAEPSTARANRQAAADTRDGGQTPSHSAEVPPTAAAALPVETVPAESAKDEATAQDTDAGDRSYTLRETHQRPRFAPQRGRRGRRRFGYRGPRLEGGSSFRSEASRAGSGEPLQINELLKEGQEILVQIAKEPLGTKGARITSHIALPGRYLVYMPTIDHIGVSRKIVSEEERLRLRNIILESKGSLTGGFIVRTAGAGRTEEEFKADLKFLSTLWNEIRAKAERAKVPALLHRDLTLVQRILRDILSPDFKMIRVDSEIEYEHTLEFVSQVQPSLLGHVKLYTRDTPLFEEFGIQAEIDKALKPKIWLKSGGYIVINQTEALVAVDVNTGKFVGKTNRLEDTIVRTNIDAVKEIVRQIRLRDLGGIIVIDFIDMDDRRNRIKVVQALEEALRSDRAPTKILSFNEFGLVALTRKRVKQSLERTLCEPCLYCSGSGWIKSIDTICCEILAEARKMSRQIEGEVVTLRVNPEVARALKSRQGVLISEMESVMHKDVIIKSDSAIHQERFEIS